MGLRRLAEAPGWRVAAGSPDIRRFKLHDEAGARVGVVEDLVFDPDAGVVRHALVDLWDRRVLVPVGLIDVDLAGRRVAARGWTRERLLGLPAWEPGSPAGEPVVSDGGHLRLLEERLEVSKRRFQTGEVTVTKRPVTEIVRDAVAVTHEEADVRRRPATDAERAAGVPAGSDDVVCIPVYAEELVVERRQVLREVIEIHKRPRVEVVQVREELRHEAIDIQT